MFLKREGLTVVLFVLSEICNKFRLTTLYIVATKILIIFDLESQRKCSESIF